VLETAAGRELSFDVGALFRRILVAIDFSPFSRDALAAALAMKRAFASSELCALAVTQFEGNDDFLRGLGDYESVGDLVRASEDRLARFVENVAPHAIGEVVCRAIVDTDLARGISLGVERWDATVVVLHAHTRTSLFRTNAEKIVQRLALPTILLKHD
jgi:hypothetical protein